MSQSRKQAILEGVERQRRRNRVISISAIVIIAIVIVTIVITLPKSNNTVPLPGYLDHCVVGSLLYHSHPGLQLTINGSTYPVPPDVGRSGACDRPIHTHPSTTNPAVFDGTLHVETDQDITYTLGDFFRIWGNAENNPTLAILNATQIFNGHVGSGRTLTVTVNGSTPPTSDPSKISLPRDAQQNSPTAYNIVITYA